MGPSLRLKRIIRRSLANTEQASSAPLELPSPARPPLHRAEDSQLPDYIAQLQIEGRHQAPRRK
jgi:hypothetical protein